MIRGLVFDFDGLMVDTESPAYESWLEIYREHECEFPFSLWSVVLGGKGDEFDPCSYLEQQVGRTLDREALTARRVQRKMELLAGQTLLPGVADYITSARSLELKLGVASSASREWVISHLDRFKVGVFFNVIVCRDDVAHVKPDPEIYRTAVTRLGIRPEEAIAFEDAPNGLLAAKRAGLFCVAVPNPVTRRLPLDNADLLLTSFTDVPLQELLVIAQDKLEDPQQQESTRASGS